MTQRWGIFLMNFCFIFYDPQSGPGWLFTLNLGFRGTLSWARIRPGETRIFRLSADWSEAEEMRWKFVGDRRFKVSCRLVPSLSWFILWKLQYFGARRGGNWGFQKLGWADKCAIITSCDSSEQSYLSTFIILAAQSRGSFQSHCLRLNTVFKVRNWKSKNFN